MLLDAANWGAYVTLKSPLERITSTRCKVTQHKGNLLLTFEMNDPEAKRDVVIPDMDVIVSFKGQPVVNITFSYETSTFQSKVEAGGECIWFAQDFSRNLKTVATVLRKAKDAPITRLTWQANAKDIGQLLGHLGLLN